MVLGIGATTASAQVTTTLTMTSSEVSSNNGGGAWNAARSIGPGTGNLTSLVVNYFDDKRFQLQHANPVSGADVHAVSEQQRRRPGRSCDAGGGHSHSAQSGDRLLGTVLLVEAEGREEHGPTSPRRVAATDDERPSSDDPSSLKTASRDRRCQSAVDDAAAASATVPEVALIEQPACRQVIRRWTRRGHRAG